MKLSLVIAVALLCAVSVRSAETSYGASTYASSTDIGTPAGGLEREASLEIKASNDDPSIGKQASHYFLSRWYDLCDIVDFSFGAGPGFLVHAQATKFAQAGFGYSDAYRVGFRGRSAGVWREKRLEAGVSLMYWQKIERERITGWVESFRADKMDLDTATVYLNNADRSLLGRWRHDSRADLGGCECPPRSSCRLRVRLVRRRHSG